MAETTAEKCEGSLRRFEMWHFTGKDKEGDFAGIHCPVCRQVFHYRGYRLPCLFEVPTHMVSVFTTEDE